jgi:hypothetical protein
MIANNVAVMNIGKIRKYGNSGIQSKGVYCSFFVVSSSLVFQPPISAREKRLVEVETRGSFSLS